MKKQSQEKTMTCRYHYIFQLKSFGELVKTIHHLALECKQRNADFEVELEHLIVETKQEWVNFSFFHLCSVLVDPAKIIWNFLLTAAIQCNCGALVLPW